MPHANPVKRKEYHAAYYKVWATTHKASIRASGRKHDRKRYATPRRKIDRQNFRSRVHHRNKVAVLQKYGKCCVYCGEDKYEVLCVDHIYNDGARHRETAEYRKFNVGGMYGYLVKTPFRPDLYQILCHNCNAAKDKYNIEPGKETYKPFDYWVEYGRKRTKHGNTK